MSTAPIGEELDLQVGGMTCASCALRIEKRLNKLPGVQATVNYATESAHVRWDPTQASPAELVATVEATGYTASVLAPEAPVDHADTVRDPASAARERLQVCAALTIPVVLMAMVPALQFTYWQWLSFALVSPVVVWGAWPFHIAAWKNARHGTATMDTLVSVGVIAAYGWSVWALFLGGAGVPGMTMPFTWMPSHSSAADLYLEVAAGVTTLILLGRYLEARAKRESGAALRALLAIGAKDVWIIVDGDERQLPIDQLGVGDEFVARPGDTIAADGVVVRGASAIDQSMLTGESVPVDVTVGDQVTGGTSNVSGRLIIKATRVGSETALARMAALVSAAQSGKAPVQRLADRVAGVFVPIVIVIALVTFAAWVLSGGGLEFAFTAAVAVLIIACPCALGLATPTALLVGTGRGAQLGIIIKGPQVLESTRSIDTVVLDKTGTVTTGRMRLTEVIAAPGADSGALLRRAGAVEHASEHPIARAIADAARAAGVLPEVHEFASEAGIGVRGVVDGRHVSVRRPTGRDAELAGGVLADALAHAQAQGSTVVVVEWDDRMQGLLVVADVPRPTSAGAITRLRELGLDPVLLTGDNAQTAAHVAREVGIPVDADHVIAEVLPAGKLAAVSALQRRGRVVAMVGDGVNDAAALAAADLGIAMGTGTDVAIEASDLTIVSGDLDSVADAIRLSRRTLSTIKGNLFWAFAYNVAAIPLAALGLLNPLIAGAAMAFSSVFVVTNSLRLRGFRPSQ